MIGSGVAWAGYSVDGRVGVLRVAFGVASPQWVRRAGVRHYEHARSPLIRDSSSSGGELMGSGGRAVDFRGAGRRRRGAAPVRLRGRAGVMKLRFGEGRRRAVGRLVVMMSGGALLCESPRPAPDSEGRSRVERHGGRG